MPVTVQMLHSQPRTELHSLIDNLFRQASRVSIAVGFLTEAGVKLISAAVQANPNSLRSLVVGATTLKACDGLDRLRNAGVPEVNLKVFLGHTRGRPEKFTKYHPMMHSKIYLFESGSQTSAIVGSHNMTGFALGGQNTEASVLISGDSDDPV